ncbi:sensor histidine kinase [Lysobacter korlensis]|uniref:histidine kinase n=1 Tax=Lysobacter korlensis TaxID=553636 RepID=A0ABV6S0N4_9GAMM
MRRFLPLARRHGFDVLIVLLTGAAMLELVIRHPADSPQERLWFQVVAIGIIVLPLFARQRFPVGAPMAYWLLAVSASFVDGRLIPGTTSVFVLTMAAAFLLGGARSVRQAQLGLAVVVGGAAVVVYNLPTHTATQLVFIPLLFGVCWFAGFAVRQRGDRAEAAEERAARAERERQSSARIAVAEERARIARELHDIVAHAVSVMVLQTGAVRHRLPDAFPEEKDALRGVEDTGRRALTEMRHLLGALRRDDEAAELGPQPGLAGLDALLEEVRGAGLPVRLDVHGDPIPLPGPIDLAAYRIAQEGLTNVLKHARASRADVVVGYAPAELRVEIRDDGDGPQPGDGLGHGLIGVRERVKIYGGELAAGPGPEGGFVLSARLPLDG